MHTRFRAVTLGIVATMLLVACGDAAASAVPTQPATAMPVATAVPATAVPAVTFAAGSRIGGVDVSGLEREAASAKVRTALKALEQPLDVSLAAQHITLDPQQISLQVPIDMLMREAEQGKSGAPVNVPLRVTYQTSAVRDQLSALATRVAMPPSVRVVTETDTISRSFVYQPGHMLNVDAALKQVDQALQAPQPRQVTLTLSNSDAAQAVSLDALQQQVAAMAAEWKGVVGFYLYDVKSKQTVTLNDKSVFSGASVMKIPILLQTYLSIPSFSDVEKGWLDAMIDKSDNMAANSLLAHVGGGTGTDDALEGVRKMDATLQELGLKRTFQNLPYEAGDYLINVRKMVIPKGPAQDGPPPYTEADPYVRTTPGEMGQLMVWIGQCAQGQGPLLERFSSTLSAARCQDMLTRLAGNEDTTRMVAGLPPGTKIAHKSGWVEDMQADVGNVSSPGGDYVLAIYVYQQQKNSYLTDKVAAPVIAAFSRLVYSAYNPTIAKSEQ